MSGRDRLGWESLNELGDGCLGLESYLGRIRSDEPAAEYALWEPRDIVALELLENGDRDLRGVSNFFKRYTTLDASLAQLRPEVRRSWLRGRCRCALCLDLRVRRRRRS